MQYPSFYDDIENIILFDELANFLGATEDGKIEISYLDCVKFAGHSCPTVASSYILAKVAIDDLNITKRSSLKISFKEPKESGVVGVVGSILGYIFGCSDEGGFKGIENSFNRANLLSYNNSKQKAFVEFENIFTKERIAYNLDSSIVPPDVRLKELLKISLSEDASKSEIEEFQRLWQDRVKKMLLNKDIWSKIALKV